jgi:hypothetical protein
MERPTINKPNAMVVIYNYKDRLGDFKLSTNENAVFEVDQIILNSLSLRSVSTQKSKSNPAGAFEFRLAPLKNWVTAITPGSWCVILMSNGLLNDSAKYGSIDDESSKQATAEGDTPPERTNSKVDERSFKMLGRIESVRAVANVNQTTGATETEYIVTGSDWGTVFNSTFYVDPISRTPGDQKAPVGMAERFGYIDYLRRAVGYEVPTLGKDADAGVNNAALKKAKSEGSKSSVNNQVDFLKNGSQGKPIDPTTTAGEEEQSTRQVSKDQKPKLPSALDNIGFILSLWGRSDPNTSAITEKSGIVVKSQQIFRMPDELVRYMGFKDAAGTPSGVISQVLKQVGGKLKDKTKETGFMDVYTNKDDSAGIIDFGTILGEHSIWQIITANSNELINECIADIRFESGKPSLALYTRVRPFAINPMDVIKKDTNAVGDNGQGGAGQKELVDPYISLYKNVRIKRIASKNVIMCSYGTNWRDRVNFIEVNIARTIFQEAWAQDVKLQSQFVDESSIGRDGLLPMIRGTTYVPAVDQAANPLGTSAYKYALKEWYFNTHKMFNGTLNLVGQDQYIQVGDNIMVESKVLNKNFNINAAQKTQAATVKTYMMAHVESVTHQTQVDANGSRVFTTSINFVRGIITDVNGNIIVSDNHVGALDQDTSLVSPSAERNAKETISTSGPMDPDRQQYPLKRGDTDFNEE